MNEKMFATFQLYCTGMIFILIWGLLLWTHYHGGVPSHHILADKDLPEISNWWGGLLLPLLSCFLLYRMKKRIMINKDQKLQKINIPVDIIYAFLSALIYGILLSIFFTLGYPDISGYIFIGIFVLALFFPIYRSECILGFVIGMTFTFGVVLPIVVGSMLALIGVFLYLCIRPLTLYVVSRFLFFRVSNRQK
jgi:fatty-acid desaturase